MSYPKHTPGPWHLHDMEAATVCGPDHLALADCNARNRVEGESMANARLIAVAPDLLAALRQIVELSANYGDGEEEPGDIAWDSMQDAYDHGCRNGAWDAAHIARKALSKAMEG